MVHGSFLEVFNHFYKMWLGGGDVIGINFIH